MSELLWVILAALAPVSELRGAIPLGLGLGLDPTLVILTSFIANCLAFFPVYIALTLLYDRLFSRFSWTRSWMDRVHRKGSKAIGRFGIPGLIIFVAIPLPITGAWTGTAIAWVLGLDWKRSFVTICAGVAIAAAIVSAISLGFLTGLGLL